MKFMTAADARILPELERQRMERIKGAEAKETRRAKIERARELGFALNNWDDFSAAGLQRFCQEYNVKPAELNEIAPIVKSYREQLSAEKAEKKLGEQQSTLASLFKDPSSTVTSGLPEAGIGNPGAYGGESGTFDSGDPSFESIRRNELTGKIPTGTMKAFGNEKELSLLKSKLPIETQGEVNKLIATGPTKKQQALDLLREKGPIETEQAVAKYNANTPGAVDRASQISDAKLENSMKIAKAGKTDINIGDRSIEKDVAEVEKRIMMDDYDPVGTQVEIDKWQRIATRPYFFINKKEEEIKPSKENWFGINVPAKVEKIQLPKSPGGEQATTQDVRDLMAMKKITWEEAIDMMFKFAGQPSPYKAK